MSDSTKAIVIKTALAVVGTIILVSSATAAVMSFMGEKEVSSSVAHTLTASVLTQHGEQLGRHDRKIDEHEKRLDSTERTQAAIVTAQGTIQTGVSNLQNQFIDLIKQTSETNAYIKSIEKEVQ